MLLNIIIVKFLFIVLYNKMILMEYGIMKVDRHILYLEI